MLLSTFFGLNFAPIRHKSLLLKYEGQNNESHDAETARDSEHEQVLGAEWRKYQQNNKNTRQTRSCKYNPSHEGRLIAIYLFQYIWKESKMTANTEECQTNKCGVGYFGVFS